jgi:hypothetical protein
MFFLLQKFIPAFFGTEKEFLAVDHVPQGFLLGDVGVAGFVLDHHPGQAWFGLGGLDSSAEVLKKTDGDIDNISDEDVIQQPDHSAHHRNTLDESGTLVK